MVDIIRKARNKESARQSRRRKAVYLELLESKVASLLKSQPMVTHIVSEDRILSTFPAWVREMLLSAINYLKNGENPQKSTVASIPQTLLDEALSLAAKIRALVAFHETVYAEIYSFSLKSDFQREFHFLNSAHD